MNRKFLSFRENEKIGIVIEDFRILYRVLKELTLWGFKFKLLNINEPIPQDLSVVLINFKTLESTLSENKIPVIKVSEETNNLVPSLLLHIVGKKIFDQVVIGIDPGTSTGQRGPALSFAPTDAG